MPLLALLIPIEVAAPVAVMASITVALIVVAQDWHKVHVRSAARLVLPTLLGIPLGLMLLRAGAEPVVKGALATLIIVFSAYSLLGGKHRQLKDDKFAWLFGFSAGVLGGAYGMNGPPWSYTVRSAGGRRNTFGRLCRDTFFQRAWQDCVVTGWPACGHPRSADSTCCPCHGRSRDIPGASDQRPDGRSPVRALCPWRPDCDWGNPAVRQ